MDFWDTFSFLCQCHIYSFSSYYMWGTVQTLKTTEEERITGQVSVLQELAFWWFLEITHRLKWSPMWVWWPRRWLTSSSRKPPMILHAEYLSLCSREDGLICWASCCSNLDFCVPADTQLWELVRCLWALEPYPVLQRHWLLTSTLWVFCTNKFMKPTHKHTN